LIQKYYEDMWNVWNFTVTDEIIHEAIEFRGSIGLTVKGRSGFKGYMNTIRAAFPDFHNTIEEMIAEDDKVVAVLTYSGTHQGTLFGVAPTGKHVQYVGTAIFRIEAGLVTRGWVLGDTLGLLQQLGAVAPLS
jgi:predicted ester cyclase